MVQGKWLNLFNRLLPLTTNLFLIMLWHAVQISLKKNSLGSLSNRFSGE